MQVMFIQLAPDLNTHDTLDELQERNQCYAADPRTWNTPLLISTQLTFCYSFELCIRKKKKALKIRVNDGWKSSFFEGSILI